MTYRALLLASASRRVFAWVHSLPAEMRQRIVMVPRIYGMSEYVHKSWPDDQWAERLMVPA